MTQIPAGTKFVGIGASVPTPENRSSQNNAFQEVYTLEDLQESVLDLTTPPNDGDVLTYDTGTSSVVWAAPTGGSDYTETIVNISSAQIKAMGVAPVVLLPELTNGYYDYFGFVEYTFGTTAYTTAGWWIANSNSYNGTIIDPLYLTMAADDFVLPFNAFASQNIYNLGFADATAIRPVYINNGGLVLTTTDGVNPTLGDGTLRVKIYHKTITFGA